MLFAPAAILDRAIVGSDLLTPDDGATTLRAQLDRRGPTLLVFLRHGGALSREGIRAVRVASDRSPLYPRVIFVHPGRPSAGRYLLHASWPGTPAISDPRRDLFEAFGLRRDDPRRLGFWQRGIQAVLGVDQSGHRIGSGGLAGSVLLAQASDPTGAAHVLWRHEPADASDLPDYIPLATYGRRSCNNASTAGGTR